MTRGLHLARITIEAESPLSVASGDIGTNDVVLQRDANGLPTIPGASLQGLFRALWGRTRGKDDVNAMFGQAKERTTVAGRLTMSAACLHNSAGVAIDGLLTGGIKDDLLCELAAEAPLLRDHVRLDHRHAADDSGKFDRTSVPVGTRFSFEVEMWGDEDEGAQFDDIVALCRHPLFRPGGASRRGYGKVKIVEARRAWLSLSDPERIRKVRDTPISDSAPLVMPVSNPVFGDIVTLDLSLRPRQLWRTGGGSAGAVSTGRSELELSPEELRRANPTARRDPVDDAPTREASVDWTSGKGELKRLGAIPCDYVLPGSSVAGPLAHRTLFHWNCALIGKPGENIAPERPVSLQKLFGHAKTKTEDQGRASAVLVDDVRFAPQAVRAVDHSSIDRLSGGVRGSALFSEELVDSGALTIRLLIDEASGIDESARIAFCEALADLTGGQLALGARSYGFFDGDADWHGATAWKAAFDDAREALAS